MQLNIEGLKDVKIAIRRSVEHMEIAEASLQKIRRTSNFAIQDKIQKMTSTIQEMEKQINKCSNWIDNAINNFIKVENVNKNVLNNAIRSSKAINSNRSKMQIEKTQTQATGAKIGTATTSMITASINSSAVNATNARLGGSLKSLLNKVSNAVKTVANTVSKVVEKVTNSKKTNYSSSKGNKNSSSGGSSASNEAAERAKRAIEEATKKAEEIAKSLTEKLKQTASNLNLQSTNSSSETLLSKLNNNQLVDYIRNTDGIFEQKETNDATNAGKACQGVHLLNKDGVVTIYDYELGVRTTIKDGKATSEEMGGGYETTVDLDKYQYWQRVVNINGASTRKPLSAEYIAKNIFARDENLSNQIKQWQEKRQDTQAESQTQTSREETNEGSWDLFDKMSKEELIEYMRNTNGIFELTDKHDTANSGKGNQGVHLSIKDGIVSIFDYELGVTTIIKDGKASSEAMGNGYETTVDLAEYQYWQRVVNINGVSTKKPLSAEYIANNIFAQDKNLSEQIKQWQEERQNVPISTEEPNHNPAEEVLNEEIISTLNLEGPWLDRLLEITGRTPQEGETKLALADKIKLYKEAGLISDAVSKYILQMEEKNQQLSKLITEYIAQKEQQTILEEQKETIPSEEPINKEINPIQGFEEPWLDRLLEITKETPEEGETKSALLDEIKLYKEAGLISDAVSKYIVQMEQKNQQLSELISKYQMQKEQQASQAAEKLEKEAIEQVSKKNETVMKEINAAMEAMSQTAFEKYLSGKLEKQEITSEQYYEASLALKLKEYEKLTGEKIDKEALSLNTQDAYYQMVEKNQAIKEEKKPQEVVVNTEAIEAIDGIMDLLEQISSNGYFMDYNTKYAENGVQKDKVQFNENKPIVADILAEMKRNGGSCDFLFTDETYRNKMFKVLDNLIQNDRTKERDYSLYSRLAKHLRWMAADYNGKLQPYEEEAKNIMANTLSAVTAESKNNWRETVKNASTTFITILQPVINLRVKYNGSGFDIGMKADCISSAQWYVCYAASGCNYEKTIERGAYGLVYNVHQLVGEGTETYLLDSIHNPEEIQEGDFLGYLRPENHVMNVAYNDKENKKIYCASINKMVVVDYDKINSGEYTASDAQPYYHIQEVLNTWHDNHPEYTVDEVTACVKEYNKQGVDKLNELIDAMEAEIDGGAEVKIEGKTYTVS